MKKLTKSLVAVVAVGVFGGGSVAFAGSLMKGEGHRARMMEKFDANQDGQLDETERKNAHAQKSAEIFKKLDTDGNGQLSLTEFQQTRKAFARHGGKH